MAILVKLKSETNPRNFPVKKSGGFVQAASELREMEEEGLGPAALVSFAAEEICAVSWYIMMAKSHLQSAIYFTVLGVSDSSLLRPSKSMLCFFKWSC